MSEAEERREALSSFLRSRRARLSPEDVGLAPGVRRRTPGLRREELALLAGVGVTWYTWLEQGRNINPSPEVLTSLARTLRLDRAETAYLFRLAGNHPLDGDVDVPDEVPAALLRLMHAQWPAPAFLMDVNWDVRAWNPGADALFGLSAWPPERCNLAWVVFGSAVHRARIVGWEAHARRFLAQLRSAYAERGGDGTAAGRRLARLIAQVRESCPEADRWLDEHQVEERAGAEKDIRHEELGLLRVDQHVLQSPGGLQLVVLAPRDAETDGRLRRLAPAAPTAVLTTIA
ncbi:helix-turn-helix transcriptional regulator [Kitasatospora aureofaciens]|uniref:helix-turn-helix transcriptional regulator n=1 Tax=Kitasatospora aureofaciens TaxID=1894 RepID=UPI001C44DF5F|nr:helix-turn-helix transcriptional regulator [Kitasatospora aureofaciens]MBV6699551.1 helix-turn-helix transcriptional regulator [Kitasatospora aureofaciens]